MYHNWALHAIFKAGPYHPNVEGLISHSCRFPLKQRSPCLDSLIRLRWDNFSSDSTGQLIQLKKIFHSLVGVRCMIFKLRRFLSCSLSYLDHRLLNPTSSLTLVSNQLFLTLFQMLSNISISPSFIASKIVSSVFVPIMRGTSFPNWVSSSATKATQSKS